MVVCMAYELMDGLIKNNLWPDVAFEGDLWGHLFIYSETGCKNQMLHQKVGISCLTNAVMFRRNSFHWNPSAWTESKMTLEMYGAMEQEFYRDRVDFVAQGGDWIISCFRFPTALLVELCAELQLHLECVLLRTHSSSTLTCALNVPLIGIYKANVLGFRWTQLHTLEFSGCL